MKNLFSHIFLKRLLGILCFIPVYLSGQVTPSLATPTVNKQLPFDPDTALYCIAFTLAIVIISLTGVLRSAIKFHFNPKKVNDTLKLFLIGLILFFGLEISQAQSTIPSATNSSIRFIFSLQGWFMLIIILIEILILIYIRKWIRYYTGIEAFEKGNVKQRISLWDKMNAFKSIEQEGDIDTGHNYDGIRELNNITPPWFTAAFMGTIVFAAIYLYRYHIAKSAPLQLLEYEITMKEADAERILYLSGQADQVDENSVALLPDGQFEEGKAIFKTACVVCHGDKGQGIVGPNMTDDYWINGGSLKAIFSTIKYGVIDKGMKSWKDDYSPNQIAQLTSYIKSLRGTNPPNPKAAQGELYKEPTVVDTIKSKPVAKQAVDSIK